MVQTTREAPNQSDNGEFTLLVKVVIASFTSYGGALMITMFCLTVQCRSVKMNNNNLSYYLKLDGQPKHDTQNPPKLSAL